MDIFVVFSIPGLRLVEVSLRLGETELRKTIRLSAERTERHNIVGHRGHAIVFDTFQAQCQLNLLDNSFSLPQPFLATRGFGSAGQQSKTAGLVHPLKTLQGAEALKCPELVTADKIREAPLFP